MDRCWTKLNAGCDRAHILIFADPALQCEPSKGLPAYQYSGVRSTVNQWRHHNNGTCFSPARNWKSKSRQTQLLLIESNSLIQSLLRFTGVGFYQIENFGSRCINSACTTSGNATVVTFKSGYNAVAIPSIISTANAALMKLASNLTFF